MRSNELDMQQEDSILSYVILFLMCPLVFFVLESSQINDQLDSHDMLISRNLYRCEERMRGILSLGAYKSRNEGTTLRQRYPAQASLGQASLDPTIKDLKNDANYK